MVKGQAEYPLFLSDHSPLVYHLRMLHFSIIVAFVAVFLFSIYNDRTEINLALDEAKELNKLFSSDSWDGNLVREYCWNPPKSLSMLREDGVIFKTFTGKRKLNITATIAGQMRVWTIWKGNTTKYNWMCETPGMEDVYKTKRKYRRIKNKLKYVQNPLSFASESGPGITLIELPKNIDQLKDRWNRLTRGLNYYRVTKIDLDNAIVFDNATSYTNVSDINVIHKGLKPYTLPESDDLQIERGVFHIYKVLDAQIAAYVGYNASKKFKMYMVVEFDKNTNQSKQTILIPLITETYKYDMMSHILDVRSINVPRGKNFSDSFPNLNKLLVADEKRNFNVPDALQDSIAIYRDQQSKSFELGGMKLEVQSVLKMGASIIVSLMIYYLLNLRALVYKLKGDNKAYTVAWIGIYPDRISFAFTISTVILAPFIVSLMQLVTFGFSQGNGVFVSIITLIALFVVSILTTLISFRLFAKVQKFATRVR